MFTERVSQRKKQEPTLRERGPPLMVRAQGKTWPSLKLTFIDGHLAFEGNVGGSCCSDSPFSGVAKLTVLAPEDCKYLQFTFDVRAADAGEAARSGAQR